MRAKWNERDLYLIRFRSVGVVIIFAIVARHRRLGKNPKTKQVTGEGKQKWNPVLTVSTTYQAVDCRWSILKNNTGEIREYDRNKGD